MTDRWQFKGGEMTDRQLRKLDRWIVGDPDGESGDGADSQPGENLDLEARQQCFEAGFALGDRGDSLPSDLVRDLGEPGAEAFTRGWHRGADRFIVRGRFRYRLALRRSPDFYLGHAAGRERVWAVHYGLEVHFSIQSRSMSPEAIGRMAKEAATAARTSLLAEAIERRRHAARLRKIGAGA